MNYENSNDYYGAPGTKLDIDIEELDRKGQEFMKREFVKPNENDIIKYKAFIEEILNHTTSFTSLELNRLKRKYKYGGKNSFLFQVYLELLKLNSVSNENEERLRKSLQIKAVKSHSGITNITVFTSPYPSYTDENGNIITQSFSCAYDCDFCPDTRNTKNPMPRSYVLLEPAVLRAAKNNFDCVDQMWDRMNTIYMIGNFVEKLEVLVLGGTFSSYPRPYCIEFVRDIYYAANNFWTKDKTIPKLTLNEEKTINETAKCRVVLIGVELRPDSITADELKYLRYLSITRLQIGIQHTDNIILNINNRKCTTEKAIESIEMLKRHGFKIDIHLMPNLPGSTPDKDRKMLIDQFCGMKAPIKREYKNTRTWSEWLKSYRPKYEQWEYYNLSNPELSYDAVKAYPCAVLDHTKILESYKDGSYIPYDEKYLKDMLVEFQSLTFPWTRINRIMRDFYDDNIYSKSGSNMNMRNQLSDILKAEGRSCMCIREREAKTKEWNGEYIIVIRQYNASNGIEYFISAESKDCKTLYGFVRLRLDDARNKIFEELNGAALIREIHVLSMVAEFGKIGQIQHKGMGKLLMKRAEEIAKENSYKKIAVISAVGSRGFYYKIGYKLDPGPGEYMLKNLI